MKHVHKSISVIITLLIFSTGLNAEEVSISGVDSRFTAISSEVNLYAVVTDADGRTLNGLESEDFLLKDSTGAGEWNENLEISGFSQAGEHRDGISFLLLIDDSASMYRNAEGMETDVWEETRVALAQREARRFLEDLGSSMDRAGLAEFGTSYRILAAPRTDRVSVSELTGLRPEPETLEAYTELYAAVVESAETMKSRKGRRVVILFSDGVNFPFAEKRGESHPEYNMHSWTPEESLSALSDEAVTLYAVRFGPDRDGSLANIARSTGGLVFDVVGEDELSGLYTAIRERVLSEYRISYRPRPTGSAETNVILTLRDGSSEGRISYESGLVFGKPSEGGYLWFSLLALPVAILIIVILVRIKAAEETEGASLGRLRPGAGESTLVNLESGKTIIEAGPAGHGTIIEPAGEANKPVGKNTIVVEQGKDGKWHVSGAEGVIVNNRKVEATILEDGDVIRAGEELIVFDDGQK